LLVAREVTDRVRSVQGGLAEIRQPATLDALSAADFAGLDQVVREQAREDHEYAIVLGRLVYAAARAKGYDRQIVDAALRLDTLLPGDDPGREREKLLRDAYVVAERTGYVEGGRIALNRLGLRALDAGDTERARQTLGLQLALGDEQSDTPTEIHAALALGDLLRKEGDRDGAQELYRRGGRSAQRLDHHRGIAEALIRQIELLPRQTDLGTLAALQRQASEAARRTADRGLQSRIVLGLAETLRRNGKTDEAVAQLVDGLAIAREIGDLGLEVRCRSALVDLERRRGNSAVVAGHERELLGLEERLGNRAAASEWANRLGSTQLALDQPSIAAEAFGRALELAVAASDLALEQRALGGLGLAFAQSGRATDALEHLMRALDLSQRTADGAGEARWLTSIGETLWRFGQVDDASRALSDALTVARKLDDPELEANLLTLLGRLHVARGQAPRARECLNRALDLNRRLGQTTEQIANLSALAALAAETGQVGSAIALCEQALQLATLSGDRAAAARLHLRLGRLSARRGDAAGGLDHVRRAVALAEPLGQPALLAQALQLLAASQHAAGDPAALETYQRAIAHCRGSEDAACEALMAVNLGLYLAAAGELDVAVAALRSGVALARDQGERGAGLVERGESALSSIALRRRPQAEPAGKAESTPPNPGEAGDDEVFGEATLPPM
jgi:tetratricopeptide (TPR) repeat protein